MIWSNSNKTKNNHNGSLITLRGVVKKYQSRAGQVTALKGIDLEVRPGEFLVIMGKSGAGKTTLVNMITGLDRCTAGEIWVAGTPVHQLQPEQAARWRGQTVGVVFQTFELLPTLTVLQNVTLPMDFAHRYSLRQQRQRAMRLLEQVEIAEHAHKPPTAVSGGQQQRVAIARAMANDPPILVADEPTGSLDSVTSEAVIDVFEELVDQGKTVVLVTHDEDVARRGSRIITLTDGELMADPNQEVSHA
ncbi:MAG: ABC transporter ATP-binding protein [Anaerolineae bacterium]|nr:ABC transporter ATP-binding protein [Anaerolineae bacterium]